MEPATTTMEPATTTVEPATTTVELTPTAESAATESTTVPAKSVTTAESAAVEPAIAAESVAAAEPAIATESVAATESAVIVAAEITIAGSIAAVEAVEPRASADENAVIEVVGTVVTVRRASVRVISVVAIGTIGSGTDVSRSRGVAWTDSNADSKSKLGVGGRARENHEEPEQAEIF